MNAIQIIEAKIATLYAAKQEIIDRIKEGVSKSTEKRLDVKFAELDLQQEILQEVLDEIEDAPAVEEAPAAPAVEEEPAVEEVEEEAPAAPAQTIYDAIIAEYGNEIIMNNKTMINRIKRETVKKVTVERDGEVRFTGHGKSRCQKLVFDYSVSVVWIKKYQQFKVIAN